MNALDYTVPPDPRGTERLPEGAMFQSTDKKPHQQAVDSPENVDGTTSETSVMITTLWKQKPRNQYE